MKIETIIENWRNTFLRFFSGVIFDNDFIKSFINGINTILTHRKIVTDITLNDDI
jgi:hypothetical protein